MNVGSCSQKTLYEHLLPNRTLLMESFMMASSIVLLALLSNIRIPLWPVPITGQTFGVFIIASFFGSWRGALSIMLYLLCGLLGLGVFSGGASGLSALLGPTGGYLVGFVFCAIFIGWLAGKGHLRTKAGVAKSYIFGSMIIYAFGLAGLWIFFSGIASPLSIPDLLMAGLVPFLIGDALKCVLAAHLYPSIGKIAVRASSFQHD